MAEWDECECGHPESDHQPEFGCWAPDCDCAEFDDGAELAYLDRRSELDVPDQPKPDEATDG